MANMTAALATVLLVLAVVQSSVAFNQWRSVPGEVLVVNGTSTTVTYTDEQFLFCHASLAAGEALDHYQVSWTTASGEPVPSWTPDTRLPSTLQGGHRGAYAYLLFRDFTTAQAGEYVCVLSYKGVKVDSSIVTVKEA